MDTNKIKENGSFYEGKLDFSNPMEHNDFFTDLFSVNVNKHTEEKNGLTYLSWAYAIAEVCKRYNQTFDYEIKRFGENSLPYVYDEGVGFMVFTSVTINGKTRECWLPVMDGANRAMLKHSYSIKTRNGEVNIAPATMFDINKTIMRCLVKNLAMFGLGLYIYAGEDLPEEMFEPATAEQIAEMEKLGVNIANALRWAGVTKIEDLSKAKAEMIISAKRGAKNEDNA